MNELTTAVNAPLQRTALTPDDVAGQLSLIQQLMKRTMVKDVDYGLIPGCGNKPTLLKPGAEKICLMLGLAPKIRSQRILLENGHREYETTCTLRSRATREFIGEGVGVCSTMESKYRYRGGKRKCPTCGAEAIIQTKKGRNPGGYWCAPDKGGCNANFNPGDESVEKQPVGKSENADIADTFNTVKKIAKKRAFVDAVLTSTGASVMFTQDIEDTHEPVEAAVVSSYVTADECNEIDELLAKSGRSWDKARQFLKLPVGTRVEEMTETDYHRLKLASLEAIAAKVPMPTQQPTPTVVPPALTPALLERQPGDPDPSAKIEAVEAKTIKAMHEASGRKWAEVLAEIGTTREAVPKYSDLTNEQYERLYKILSPAKAG